MSVALLGCQTPRLQVAPPAAHYYSGDDAIAFGVKAGIPLDEWQKTGIRNGMGRRADGNWAAFEVCVICQRQNGKGSITDVVELYALFVLGLPLIIHSAHRLDTSRKAFRVVKAIIERNPDLARRCKPINDSDEHIETLGGCRLEFRTRTKSGGRGFTCNLLILDEALELTAEQIQAIVPTLAAIPGAQLWYTSTVPKFGDQHLCRVRRDAKAGKPRLAYVEWGADQRARLDDPEALAQANPAFNVRITMERLEDLRRILGDDAFKTECMGIWPPSADDLWQIISETAWDDRKDPESKAERGISLGVSMTNDRSMVFIGYMGSREAGGRHMGLRARLVGSGEAVARIVAFRDERKKLGGVCAVVIGANDPARSLVADLREAGIEVLTPGTSDVAAECGAVYDALTGEGEGAVRDLWHSGKEEPLREAMAAAVKRVVSSKLWLWEWKDVAVDPAALYSITFASYGYRVNPPSKYNPLNNIW